MDTRHERDLDRLLNAILIASTAATFIACAFLLQNPTKSFTNRGKRIVFCLFISDFIGSLFWTLNNYFPGGCPYFGMLNLFGYNASAMWTCAIGLFIYVNIKGKAVPPDKFFHVVCWGPPLATVIIAASYRQIAIIAISGCWLKTDIAQLIYSSVPQYPSYKYLYHASLRLKIQSRPSTPTLNSSTAASKGQKGMLLMHGCYLFYTIGPVVQVVTGKETVTFAYVAMCLAASKGLLNAFAVNEGRLRRLAESSYLIGDNMHGREWENKE